MKTNNFKLNKYTGVLLCSVLMLFACSKEEEPINRPPNSFNLIEVPNGATDIGLQPQFKWEAAMDPDYDQVTYQVYLDAQNPPQTSIVNNLDVNTFTIEDALQPETTYYWKAVAKDTQGNTTESNVVSFTTRVLTNGEAIIGKWFYESILGQPPFSDCYKRSFLHFTTELTLHNEIRSQGGSSNLCGIEFSDDYIYEVIDDKIKLDNIENIVIESITDTELVLLLGGDHYTFRKE